MIISSSGALLEAKDPLKKVSKSASISTLDRFKSGKRDTRQISSAISSNPPPSTNSDRVNLGVQPQKINFDIKSYRFKKTNKTFTEDFLGNISAHKNRSVISFTKELSREKASTIPTELLNSPYLGAREKSILNLKCAKIEKFLAPKTDDGEANFKNHASIDKDEEKFQSSKSLRKLPNYLTTADLRLMSNGRANKFNLPPVITHKKAHPYLSKNKTRWKKHSLSKTIVTARLEKQAKVVVDKAIENGRVFTCDAPYPVDTYVRIALRRRGWVERFRLKECSSGSLTTGTKQSNSTQILAEDDEDYAAICDHDIPPPWEEQNGIYDIMSRLARHTAPRFIWGGKQVNNLVLRKEVITNHFPKAKYFSSKVLLTKSLKDLHWLTSEDSSSFFPRSFVLTEDEKDDIIENFRITTCISLLKWVVDSCFDSSDSSKNTKEDINSNSLQKTVCIDASAEKYSQNDEPSELIKVSSSNDTTFPETSQDCCQNADCSSDNELACNSETLKSNEAAKLRFEDEYVKDANGEMVLRVKPEIIFRDQRGGLVPAKPVKMAVKYCKEYLKCLRHEDLDAKKFAFRSSQWEKLLEWFYALTQENASFERLPEALVRDAVGVLGEMEKVWPQSDIDGKRNIWIVKPGEKSKGIGIEFLETLDEILEYIGSTTEPYILQKYVERPLLIHKCKFDIRQWFLVTGWNPLTIWFYKDCYLRICSQEYCYSSMHKSIHLSNVAIQQFYLNGKRSEKLPENNFMTSSTLKTYLSEQGAETAWDDIIYPGMKNAIINTLVATQDITESRQNAFELYGGDFILSEEYRPYLLEINSSPGMAPSSRRKAKLCASVIDDTFKVVLDRKTNKTCDTGGFELIFQGPALPEEIPIFQKLIVEGTRIKRKDLQNYAQVDRDYISEKEDDISTDCDVTYKQNSKDMEHSCNAAREI